MSRPSPPDLSGDSGSKPNTFDTENATMEAGVQVWAKGRERAVWGAEGQLRGLWC